MPKPIKFSCSQVIQKPAGYICANIADMARWSDFNGFGILPGIEQAVYETRTDDMVGSRIFVQNRDGSTHIEEIQIWETGKRIVMKLHEFSPPLDRLADYFLETWGFDEKTDGVLVTRSFELYPKNSLVRPFIWIISLMFRRAIAQHLSEMAAEAGENPPGIEQLF